MRALRKHAIQLLPAQSWSRRDSTVAASEARRLLITCQCGSRTYRERVTQTHTPTPTSVPIWVFILTRVSPISTELQYTNTEITFHNKL